MSPPLGHAAAAARSWWILPVLVKSAACCWYRHSVNLHAVHCHFLWRELTLNYCSLMQKPCNKSYLHKVCSVNEVVTLPAQFRGSSLWCCCQGIKRQWRWNKDYITKRPDSFWTRIPLFSRFVSFLFFIHPENFHWSHLSCVGKS